MASTAGARHLAVSAIWMAARQPDKPLIKIGTFLETALEHMEDDKRLAFLRWLEDALESS
jgi:hypothetical protein